MPEINYWIAFSQLYRIGGKRFQLLRNHFPSLEAAWNGTRAEYVRAGLDEKTVEEVFAQKIHVDPDAELEKMEKENVRVVTVDDPQYPKLLKQTYCPPFLLYYRGDLKNLHEQALAVVGTRKISNYGKLITPELVQELAAQGLIIVSGLALGVDSLAHLTAIENHQTTVAVLGSGLDWQNIYPSSNRTLAKQILENNGLIISEFPIGMMPLRHNFPARNRIISGLSLGTLVIEAGESSGALITAQFALEQNREVFAVPGAISFPMSVGTNALIKRGAKLVQTAQDVFDELNLKQLNLFKTAEQTIPASPEEATVLKHLQNEPLHINEIIKLSSLTAAEVSATLIMLEMKGRIRNVGSMTYVVVKS